MENEVKLASGAMVALGVATAALVVMPYMQVRDVAHLYHVIDRLRHLPSVMEVLRKTANEE